MGREIGEFGLAQDMIRAIQKVVRDEMNRLRPNPRYARVMEINEEDRSCVVSFIGEGDNPVRVPYGSVKPSDVGQEVRIGGTAADRRIEDVRGPDSSESRVMTLEEQLAERQFAFVRARMIGGPSLNNTSDTKLPFVQTPQPPLGIESDTSGGWVAPMDGYYDLSAKVGLDGSTGVSEAWAFLRILRGGGPIATVDQDTFGQDPEEGAQYGYSLNMRGLWYMNAGDVAAVYGRGRGGASIQVGYSYFEMRLYAAIPRAQLPQTG